MLGQDMRAGTVKIAATLAVILTMGAGAVRAMAEPLPPCAAVGSTVKPAYAPVETGPAVGSWRDITLGVGDGCPAALNGSAELVVAMSRRFIHDGSVNDLAARVGAVSALEGLRYWSVTAGGWRDLIVQSHAMLELDGGQRRQDYSAPEVLSGRTLFIAQSDSRSSGLNTYSLTASSVTEDQMVVTLVNQTNIRFLLAPLFPKQALVSVHFFTRLSGNEWGYYSLTMVREAGLSGNIASYVNRAAAFERFYTGRQSDGEPPVVR